MAIGSFDAETPDDEWAVQRARYMTLEPIAPLSGSDLQVACRGSLTKLAKPAGEQQTTPLLHHTLGHDLRYGIP